MSIRYLDATEVTLPSRAPLFVEEGHCQWCNKPLTGRQRLYCSESCTFSFYNYWCSRPAYVRATFIRDNFTCQECGYHEMLQDRSWLPDMSKLECDHIIPLARGGETTMDNLQTLCKEHNRRKGIKLDGEVDSESTPIYRGGNGSKCPYCRGERYCAIPWQPPEGYDPLMKKVQCRACKEESYLAPVVGKRREK